MLKQKHAIVQIGLIIPKRTFERFEDMFDL